MFSGEDVLYEGESTMDPVFINELAYYEEGIAFLQTEKLTFSVPALPAVTSTPPGSLIQATSARHQPSLLNRGS